MIDNGFTAKQLILADNLILRAHNENYADIVVKGSLELFGKGSRVALNALSCEIEKVTQLLEMVF